MFGRCHRRLQDRDRAGEPADRSRDMLKLARPCRPSLASTRSRGVLKETKKGTSISRSGDTGFGLGQLLRARIRPMAGDSPSGYSLTGQSGLVFDVAHAHRYVHMWSRAHRARAPRGAQESREKEKHVQTTTTNCLTCQWHDHETRESAESPLYTTRYSGQPCSSHGSCR